MELNFYDVRIGTRTRTGNLNVIHSFVCKSVEPQEYKIRNFYQSRYSGLSIDVFKVIEVVEVPQDAIQKDSNPFEIEKSESRKKIIELEREIKKLQESKNSQFSMEIDNVDINEGNQLLYKKVIEDYKVYTQSIVDLEAGIKSQIMDKYRPFASSISTSERMSGTNRTMKFKLNLKNQLF